MRVARCPKHQIPYNADNPRGCPACAAEKEGGGGASMMQDLARASRGVPAPTEAEIAAPGRARPSRPSAGAPPEAPEEWPPPVTKQPTPPTFRVSRTRALVLWIGRHRALSLVTGLAGVGFLWLLWAVVPRFSARLDPPLIDSEPKPLPLEPGHPISMAFAILGTQPPGTHPSNPRLARYVYGDDLTIDEYNGVLFGLTLRSPLYAWHGLRVAAPELHAEGSLALLGATVRSESRAATPEIIGGYQVFRSPDGRPQRTLATQLRPPAGCADIAVRLEPRLIGRVTRGSERFFAVSRRNSLPDWAVTRVEIASRAVSLPGGPPSPC